MVELRAEPRKRGVLVSPLAWRPVLSPVYRAVHFQVLAMPSGLAQRVAKFYRLLRRRFTVSRAVHDHSRRQNSVDAGDRRSLGEKFRIRDSGFGIRDLIFEIQDLRFEIRNFA